MCNVMSDIGFKEELGMLSKYDDDDDDDECRFVICV